MEPATCAESRPHALPIDGLIPAITAALAPPGSTLLLQAPPGAGKTTRVPLALLGATPGTDKILMLEPRRLAAKAAAQRLAGELGEPVGQRVGYSVRLESRTSAATRLEVLTSGLFLRRLQADPELAGVTAVVLDEFHERGADTELALVLLRQAREVLNPALRLLVMSATLQIEALAEHWPQAKVLRSEGREHPVQISYQRPKRDEPLAHQVVRALSSHWRDAPRAGRTALVFLPGLAEIGRTQRALEATSWSDNDDLTVLHGNLTLAEQSQAIRPARPGQGKVVLTTSIAESSLTIAGVELVIDSGLSRRSRFDPRSGMDGLITESASQASAEQRKGRAGRLGPGRCVRLWSELEQQRRPAFDTPELLACDPVPLALQLALWGEPLGAGLPWLVAPPRASLKEARVLLEQLGALEPGGRLSAHGRAMGQLGVHPRLAHMLLRACEQGWQHRAASLAVLLSERDPLDRSSTGSDLGARLSWLDKHQPRNPQWQRQQQQRQALLAQLPAPHKPTGAAPAEAAAVLLSWAYPERVALARADQPGRFVLRNGRGAALPPHDPLAAQSALAVASVDGQHNDARIQLALPLPLETLLLQARDSGTVQPCISWDNQAERVRCEQQLKLGALVLERRPLNEADQQAIGELLLEQVRSRGLSVLPWSEGARQLQQRLEIAHQWLGDPWPSRSDSALLNDLASWLGPQLLGLRSLEDLQRLDLQTCLWGELTWESRQQLETLLPSTLAIASGRLARLDYREGRPVLAVKLQEMFGTTAHPSVMQGRMPVRLELLSPAGRPAAVSEDLLHFWRHTYSEVRRDLRGRYPKHPWPEDPTTAVATAGTKRQQQQQRS